MLPLLNNRIGEDKVTYIFINKSKFKKLGNTVEKVGKRVRDIDDDFNSVRNKLDWDIQASENIDRRLEDIHNDLERYVNVLEKMKSFLEEAERAYELLDKESLEDIESIIEPIALPVEQDNKILNNIAKWFGDTLFKGLSELDLNNLGTFSFIDFTKLLPKDSDSVFHDKWGIFDVDALGYEATADKLTGYLSRFQFGDAFKYGSHSAEISVGKGEIRDEISFKDGVSVDLGAEASLLDGEYTLDLGNKYLNSKTELSAAVVKGEASGKSEFGFDEEGLDAYLEGELMYSTFEAEASQTFSIPFVDITFTGKGSVGSIGVEGKIGFEDGKFSVKAGGALGVGYTGGFEVGIDYDDWKLVAEGVGALNKYINEHFEWWPWGE